MIIDLGELFLDITRAANVSRIFRSITLTLMMLSIFGCLMSLQWLSLLHGRLATLGGFYGALGASPDTVCAAVLHISEISSQTDLYSCRSNFFFLFGVWACTVDPPI